MDLNEHAPAEIHGPAFPLDLPDASVDEIRAVDVAEHVSYRDTATMFAEWARVLVPGGKLYVQVPDAGTCLQWYQEAPDRLVDRLPPDLPQTPLMGLTWRLLGGHADGVAIRAADPWWLNCHAALFTEASLRMALAGAGFTVESVTCNIHPNLCCHARRQ